jgi:hypothetical protein
MFAWLARAVSAVTGTVSSTISGWVHDVVAGLYSFLHTIFGLVGKAWDGLTRSVGDFVHSAEAFADWVASGFEHLYRYLIPGILAWIHRDILDPLLGALRWIETKGAEVYYYISHPAALVDLIWDDVIAKLESAAVSDTEKLGNWLIGLLYNHTKQLLTMIEDVLDALL